MSRRSSSRDAPLVRRINVASKLENTALKLFYAGRACLLEFCISRRPHNKPAKKNRSGSGDCFAIIVQAAQWKMPPFAVARKTHVVNGALGYEAQLINAVVASINVISDRFRYDCCGNWDCKILSFYTNLFISLENHLPSGQI